MSCAEQLDLFAATGANAAAAAPITRAPAPPPEELDEVALLAAIPTSGLVNGPALAAEAGRRRLIAAIPVLENYCRRFAGFGLHHALPEQVAALEALAAIGGADAARSVGTIIMRCWVQGPTLAVAVNVAAQLGSHLPPAIVVSLLRHPVPAVRGDACRLARRGPEVVTTLTDLLGDLNHNVHIEAACALGHMSRPEALPVLKRALRAAPNAQVIAAVPPIADEECIVVLGRLARGPAKELAAAAIEALETVEHPVAKRLLEQLG
jgi:hypothetical protein